MTRRERSSARTWAGTSTVIPLVARRELWPSLAGPTGAKLCVHDHGLAWEIGRERSPHGQFGTHLSRGAIYYIAYRWNGREYRESTRSTERRVAERLLASRVADGRGRGHHGPRITVTPGHASVELTRTSASPTERRPMLGVVSPRSPRVPVAPAPSPLRCRPPERMWRARQPCSRTTGRACL